MPSRKLHKNASTCHRCGQPVIWATTEAGLNQALDPTPNPAGSVLAYNDVHGWRARSVSSAGDSPRHPLARIYMPHEATCRGPKQLTTV